jgi:hypothetical protein
LSSQQLQSIATINSIITIRKMKIENGIIYGEIDEPDTIKIDGIWYKKTVGGYKTKGTTDDYHLEIRYIKVNSIKEQNQLNKQSNLLNQ